MAYHPHKRLPKPKNKSFDTFVSVVAVVAPVMTLPQVYTIFSTKNADGVSLISWSAYVATSAIWFIYGLAHKEKPIILNSLIGGTLSLIVALGAAIY